MGSEDLTQVLTLPRHGHDSRNHHHLSSLCLGTLQEQKPQPACRGRAQGTCGWGQRALEHCQMEEGACSQKQGPCHTPTLPSMARFRHPLPTRGLPLFRQLRATSTPKVGSLENYISLIAHNPEETFLQALMGIPGSERGSNLPEAHSRGM